jgi:hypothetical protein
MEHVKLYSDSRREVTSQKRALTPSETGLTRQEYPVHFWGPPRVFLKNANQTRKYKFLGSLVAVIFLGGIIHSC